MQAAALEVVRAEGGRFHWKGLALSSRFQSIHCVESGVAIGDEALLRALDADGEPLRPRAIFEGLDAEERVSLDWICRTVHLRSHAVRDAGDRRLFLNIDPEALATDPDHGQAFATLTRFYGIAPERIVLEIRDGDAGDEGALAAAADAHRELGFTIAMDAFGEGRSNFDRVAALRPRIVKVDRAVLEATLGERQAGRRLASLVGMLGDSGIDVVVQGVEDARHAVAAIEAGAAYVQGMHLGAPTRGERDEVLTRSLILSARRLVAA